MDWSSRPSLVPSRITQPQASGFHGKLNLWAAPMPGWCQQSRALDVLQHQGYLSELWLQMCTTPVLATSAPSFWPASVLKVLKETLPAKNTKPNKAVLQKWRREKACSRKTEDEGINDYQNCFTRNGKGRSSSSKKKRMLRSNTKQSQSLKLTVKTKYTD